MPLNGSILSCKTFLYFIYIHLLKTINSLYKNNDFEKLNYLYYEYFNKIENNNEKIYNSLILSMDNFNSKHTALYDILTLSSKK